MRNERQRRLVCVLVSSKLWSSFHPTFLYISTHFVLRFSLDNPRAPLRRMRGRNERQRRLVFGVVVPTFCTHYSRSLSADPLTFVFHFSLTPRRKRTRGASHVDQRLRGCSQFCRLPRMLYHVVHSQIDLCDSLSGTRDMLRSLLCHHGAVFGFPFGLPFGSKQPT